MAIHFETRTSNFQHVLGLTNMGLDLRNSLDEDESSLLSKALPSISSQPGVQPAAEQSSARGKAGAKPAKAKAPGAVASKVRKDTLRLYSTITMQAKSALSAGEQVLGLAEEAYGGLEAAVNTDESVKILSHRLRCLDLLLDETSKQPDETTSQAIFEELCQDEFFSDQSWSTAHVHTVGNMVYVRSTMLELQRTCDAVEAMGQTHKDAIGLLRDVSSSVAKAASEWKSRVAALKKAQELERKALEKEAERVRKAAEKKAEAEKMKLQKKQAEEEKAAKQKADDDSKEKGTKDIRKRRKKQANADEIDEDDFALLKSITSENFPRECLFRTEQTIEDLAKFIVSTAGMVSGVARCRRSALKKCFEAWVARLYTLH